MLTIVRKQIAAVLAEVVAMNAEAIEIALEVPKKLEHGHLAFPTFALAKTQRKPPPQIAAAVCTEINQRQLPELQSATAVGGYVNFTFHNHYLQNVLSEAVGQRSVTELGCSERGRGQKIVIDYASPNVAKPMHVGHLRATMIGQAIRNLAESQGYEVIGLNHLGDWGVQFGKLAWAYEQWGHEYPFKEKPFQSLFELYVRFHKEAERRPELDQIGSETFHRLENGDAAIEKLWKMFVEITLVEDQKLWDILGVRHDLVLGESFYNDKLAAVENALKAKGLLEESQGAQVVKLDELNLPPCLIRKSDGASLYATRDLAAAIYRIENLHATMALYVVGQDQSLHFTQVFAVLKKMGYQWVDNCHHIGFGLVKFVGQEAMSTRTGQVIFLEDVIRQAVERTRQIIAEKNPELTDAERVAEQVGVGAVIFNDLVNDRVRDVEFDWDRLLDFEGDTGPYVQYSGVRARSILKKAARQLPEKMPAELTSPEERELIRLLMLYADTLKNAFDHYKPNILAQYLLDLCHHFSHFYQKHRVLGVEPDVETSRLILVSWVQKVIEAGLARLSIHSPQAM